MPRGIAWDDLPNSYTRDQKPQDKPVEKNASNNLNTSAPTEAREVNFQEDLLGIGKRVAFGSITGGITGAAFGFIEVLRNSKLLTGRRTEATNKILGFTYRFAGFFGFYHGARKTLKLYVPTDAETNVAIAAASTIVPMIVMPNLRPMIPYAVCMILMDAWNGLHDV